MDRPKLTEFTFPKTLGDIPFPIAEAGLLLEKNAGFRTSKPIINSGKCVKCMMCYLLCPEGTVYKDGDQLAIDYDFCKGCGICERECKPNAIKNGSGGVEMSSYKDFISGDDAVAIGVKLVKPDVIAAYPITPQTIVVERLSEYVEDGSLNSEYIHVESEHSAIMAALGASSVGSRTFTATSSQGLLYMAEGLPYVSGSRFPVVMMNANRTTAVPWSIFNDHSDSMLFLNSGWIQVHVEDAQEALDMVIQAYKIAEDPAVSTPIMINVDGFILTHTYELVEIPEQELVDQFLPPYVTEHKMSLDKPMSVCIGVGPELHTEFRYKQQKDFEQIAKVADKVDQDFAEAFGRAYGGLVEKYCCDDAEVILVTVGSVTSTARAAVDKMRQDGHKTGLLKLRYLRPFPLEEFVSLGESAKAIGVLDKNISYGYEGTVFTNVNSALSRLNQSPPTLNFIAGLGGRNISKEDIEGMFLDLLNFDENSTQDRVKFVNLNLEEAVKENEK